MDDENARAKHRKRASASAPAGSSPARAERKAGAAEADAQSPAKQREAGGRYRPRHLAGKTSPGLPVFLPPTPAPVQSATRVPRQPATNAASELTTIKAASHETDRTTPPAVAESNRRQTAAKSKPRTRSVPTQLPFDATEAEARMASGADAAAPSDETPTTVSAADDKTGKAKATGTRARKAAAPKPTEPTATSARKSPPAKTTASADATQATLPAGKASPKPRRTSDATKAAPPASEAPVKAAKKAASTEQKPTAGTRRATAAETGPTTPTKATPPAKRKAAKAAAPTPPEQRESDRSEQKTRRSAKRTTSAATTDETVAATDTNPAAEPVAGSATTSMQPLEPASSTVVVVTGEVVRAAATAVVPSWQEFKAKPGYAGELLALAAVARFADPIRANLTWLRDTYPNATSDGLARVAVQRFVRQARNSGFAAGLLGPLAVLADVTALHIVHTRLILHIAAAYGLDPSDPERATELLVLQGVHPTMKAARASLQAAQALAFPTPTRTTTSTVELAGPRNGAPPMSDGLSKPLLRTVGAAAVRIGVRRVLRTIPGAGALVGAAANVRSTEAVARRAIRFYRVRASGRTSSVT
jgi:EcsC protein family